MSLIADFFEFVIYPPLRKASLWYADHFRYKRVWWHP